LLQRQSARPCSHC